MAQAPQVPNFSQYNFTLGDTQEAITKQNGQNAALIQFGNGLQAMLNEMGAEQQQTLQSATQIRQQTVQEVDALKDAAEQAAGSASSERQAAQQARQESEAARDDAQRIAVGDVAVTELQQGEGKPGELLKVGQDGLEWQEKGQPGDLLMAGQDGPEWKEKGQPGGLLMATQDGLEWQEKGQPGQILMATQDGQEWSNTLKRYDMPRGETTAALNLAAFNNFRINASAVRTLTLQNAPGGDRTMTVILTLVGNRTPNWPSQWNGAWTSGAAPTVGNNRSRVVAYWDGDEWSVTMVMRK